MPSPSSGVAVFDSVPYDGTSGWFDVGGTSAAAPAWAGLVAITDQGLAASGKGTLSTTQLLTDLYALPSTDYHDITSGFNGYSAGTGYDLVTGLGTPVANQLVPGLLAANGVAAATIATPPSATSHQAGTSSTAHNAAVVSSSSTGTLIVAATSATNASSTVALAALPGTTTTSTAATTSSGLSQQAATASAAASPSVNALGQGLASGQSSSSLTESSDSDEGSPAPTDLVQANPDGEQPAPTEPATGSPDPGMPVPEIGPPESPARLAPGDEDVSAPPRPISWAAPHDEADPTMDRLIANASAPRLERESGREEETSDLGRRSEVSLAGLAAAGAVVALGHRIILGRNTRRRPMTAAFHASGR